VEIHGANAQPGDVVLISGTLGDHGIAVLTARGDLGFETAIQSDVAPLNHLIQAVLKAAPHTHVLRDPTRGGLATTLNEIAGKAKSASPLMRQPFRSNLQSVRHVKCWGLTRSILPTREK